MLVSIISMPKSVKMVLTEEEIFLMNDIFYNAAVDSYSIFIILCVLTFSQKKQKEIAYLSNRQKD